MEELIERVNRLEKRIADLERVLRPAIAPHPVAVAKRLAIARVLSGASMHARSKGVVHTHDQISKLLPSGVETLAYAMGLAGAVAVDDPKRHVKRAAFIISEASDILLARKEEA